MQENCVQSTGICSKMIKAHIREPDAKCSEVVQRKDDLTGEISRGVGGGGVEPSVLHEVQDEFV